MDTRTKMSKIFPSIILAIFLCSFTDGRPRAQHDEGVLQNQANSLYSSDTESVSPNFEVQKPPQHIPPDFKENSSGDEKYDLLVSKQNEEQEFNFLSQNSGNGDLNSLEMEGEGSGSASRLNINRRAVVLNQGDVQVPKPVENVDANGGVVQPKISQQNSVNEVEQKSVQMQGAQNPVVLDAEIEKTDPAKQTGPDSPNADGVQIVKKLLPMQGVSNPPSISDNNAKSNNPILPAVTVVPVVKVSISIAPNLPTPQPDLAGPASNSAPPPSPIAAPPVQVSPAGGLIGSNVSTTNTEVSPEANLTQPILVTPLSNLTDSEASVSPVVIANASSGPEIPTNASFSLDQSNSTTGINETSVPIPVPSSIEEQAALKSADTIDSELPDQNVGPKSSDVNANPAAIEVAQTIPNLTPPNVVVVIKPCGRPTGKDANKDLLAVEIKSNGPINRPVDPDPKLLKREVPIAQASEHLNLKEILLRYVAMLPDSANGLDRVARRKLLSIPEGTSKFEMMPSTDDSEEAEEENKEENEQSPKQFSFRNQQIDTNQNWRQVFHVGAMKNPSPLMEKKFGFQNKIGNSLNKQELLPAKFKDVFKNIPNLAQQPQQSSFGNDAPLQHNYRKAMNSPKVDQLNSNGSPMEENLTVGKGNVPLGKMSAPKITKNNVDDSDWNDFSKYNDPSHVMPEGKNANNPTEWSDVRFGQKLPQPPVNQLSNQIPVDNSWMKPNPTFWNPLQQAPKNSVNGNSLSDVTGDHKEMGTAEGSLNLQHPNSILEHQGIMHFPNLEGSATSDEPSPKKYPGQIIQQSPPVQNSGVLRPIEEQLGQYQNGETFKILKQGEVVPVIEAVPNQRPFDISAEHQLQNNGQLIEGSKNIPANEKGAAVSNSDLDNKPIEVTAVEVISEVLPEVQKASKDYKIASIVDVIKNRYLDLGAKREEMFDKPSKDVFQLGNGSSTVIGTSAILLQLCLFVALALLA